MLDLSKIKYTEPSGSKCCKAARTFEIKHETKSKECWLLIHGFTGYPGEMVRPAVDLFEAGFDVFVPRLPGHGTTTEDFISSRSIDWLGHAKQALDSLKTKYEKVNLLGHSMGGAIVSILENDPAVGKVVLACPCITTTMFSIKNKFLLHILLPFVKKIKSGWTYNNEYHMYYENAPADDEYLGIQYYQYNFIRQTLDLIKLCKTAYKNLCSSKKNHLVINSLCDIEISEPSVKLIKKALGNMAKVVDIPNGTHLIFYDKDSKAEETAVQAVVEYAKK